MSRSDRWLPTDPRKAALDVLVRYWGLGTMKKEKALAHIPLLEFGEEDEEWDEEKFDRESELGEPVTVPSRRPSSGAR